MDSQHGPQTKISSIYIHVALTLKMDRRFKTMPYEKNFHTYLSRSDLWIGSQYSSFLQYVRVSEGKLLHTYKYVEIVNV